MLLKHGYNPMQAPKPLPKLETPDPEQKFPAPPGSMKIEPEKNEATEFSGIKDKEMVVDEEVLMEKIVQVRKASDAVVQAYRGIADVANWEPEEKWEMIEDLIKLSEAISDLKYPLDLVQQASDHNERMKKLEITGKQINTRTIEDEFIHKAGEEINKATALIAENSPEKFSSPKIDMENAA
jgi:hypothetical protein